MSTDHDPDHPNEGRPDVQQFLKQLHARKAQRETGATRPAPASLAPPSAKPARPAPPPHAPRPSPAPRNGFFSRASEKVPDSPTGTQEPRRATPEPQDSPQQGPRPPQPRPAQAQQVPSPRPPAPRQPEVPRPRIPPGASRPGEHLVAVEREKTQRILKAIGLVSLILSMLVLVFAPAGREITSYVSTAGLAIVGLWAIAFDFVRKLFKS